LTTALKETDDAAVVVVVASAVYCTKYNPVWALVKEVVLAACVQPLI
jgi:hypothetical protein